MEEVALHAPRLYRWRLPLTVMIVACAVGSLAAAVQILLNLFISELHDDRFFLYIGSGSYESIDPLVPAIIYYMVGLTAFCLLFCFAPRWVLANRQALICSVTALSYVYFSYAGLGISIDGHEIVSLISWLPRVTLVATIHPLFILYLYLLLICIAVFISKKRIIGGLSKSAKGFAFSVVLITIIGTIVWLHYYDALTLMVLY